MKSGRQHRTSVGGESRTDDAPIGYRYEPLVPRARRALHRVSAEAPPEPPPAPPDRPAAPPRLLVVATVSGTLGAFIAPYARHFRALGWRVEAAAAGADADARVLDAFDLAHDLPLSRSIRDLRGLAGAARALQQLLRDPPDIVHVHTPIASFLTRYLVSRVPGARRPKLAYTAHGFHAHVGGPALSNAAFLTAERIAGRWTDRLIVINDEDEAAARRHRIVRRGRLVRMPGIGLDTSHYDPARVDPADAAAVRAEHGVPGDAPLFTIVGELSPNKRQADAIAALARLSHPDAHLALAGEGRERPALQDQAQALGVAPRVHLLGHVRDVRPLVRASTALLLLSGREGLARSVMEALSLAVPVIASAARGNRELVGDDRGMVVEIGDVDGLARAMASLIDRPEERLAMGLRGRARMVQRYDLGLLIEMHEALYRGMLAERQAG